MTSILVDGHNNFDLSTSNPEGDVFRSMNVDGTSKTPYSDATQVQY